MDEQNTVPVASSMIEAKLTKSEAIKILVSDIVRDLKRTLANAKAEKEKAQIIDPSLITPEFLRTFQVELKFSNYGKGSFYVNFERRRDREFRVQDLPEGLRERAKKIADLEKAEDEIEEQIRRLTTDRVETEVTILKTVLEKSAEGREWLAQIDDLRHAAQRRLNIKVDMKLLSGKS